MWSMRKPSKAFGNQLEDFRVGGFEHCRALDAQTAEFVDIEKAPPVDVIRRRAPTGQTITLTLKQVVQVLETFRVERVVGAELLLDGVQYRRITCQFS